MSNKQVYYSSCGENSKLACALYTCISIEPSQLVEGKSNASPKAASEAGAAPFQGFSSVLGSGKMVRNQLDVKVASTVPNSDNNVSLNCMYVCVCTFQVIAVLTCCVCVCRRKLSF